MDDDRERADDPDPELDPDSEPDSDDFEPDVLEIPEDPGGGDDDDDESFPAESDLPGDDDTPNW